MGKSARKRKEKRKDFQKVKLKVGKKKALPDNVTNTNFKSRAIHIKEQLKSDETQPTNQRKQNIQELFTHLNHYNTAMRVESLSGLKDLFLRHPQLISTHLSSIIEHVSSVLMDKESDVRRSAIGLLNFVLPHITGNQVMPFFPILNSHLCCAMTHINEDIQLDSLKVLDLVLKFYPSLVTKHSRQLLPNFVDQISRESGGKASSAGETARALTVNPSSKLSSQKWRRKVLQRLNQFLQALWMTEDCPQRDSEEQSSSTVTWNDSSPTHVRLYFHTGTKPNIATSFTLRPPGSDVVTADDYLSHPKDLLEFIHTLVPILLQIWVEANPGLLATDLPGNHLSAEAMETFHGILSILQLLWRRMAEISGNDDDYMEKLTRFYLKDFNHHLMTCFPYASRHPLQNKRQAGKGATAVTGVVLNLAVCELMSYFVSKEKGRDKWVKALVGYVCEFLQEQKQISPVHLKTTLEFVKRCNKTLVHSGVSEQLLRSVLVCYQGCHLLSQNKRLIISFLSDLVLHSSHGYNRQPILNKWIQGLPKLLIDLKNRALATTASVLQVITMATAQRIQPLLESLQENIVKIYDLSEELVSLPNSNQRKIIELLYHVPTVTKETFVNLARWCHDDRLPSVNIAYMLHILYSRYQQSQSTVRWGCNQSLPFQTIDFLQFLFSVLIGSTDAHLRNLASEEANSTPTEIMALPPSVCRVSITPQSWDVFRRHQLITKTVCEIFSMLSGSSQVWQVLQSALEFLLAQYCRLPISAIYAILYCISHLYPGNRSSSPSNKDEMTHSMKQSASVCCLAVLYHTTQVYRSGLYGNNSWEMHLMDLVTTVFTNINDIRYAFLEYVQELISRNLEPNHIQGIALIMVKLLQTNELREAIKESENQIRNIVQTVMKCPNTDQSSQWMAELRYESRLLLPASSKL
ncbi:testis-expressed protein 10 homolog [Ptychodera flava]|uniref:testis-expressed protein 10 homolog n=1 Tax=Ptychodera flava TaxID=63121 RepID=UPI00396A9580